jgi:hypothetical protein
MAHELCNGSDEMHIPCTMGCTTHPRVYYSHAAWVAQPNLEYTLPMDDGLYNAAENIYCPCCMGCTTYLRAENRT